MSLLSNPPRETKSSFRVGDTHLGVWAIQRFINRVYKAGLVEDGVFGDRTDIWVRKYQADVRLPSDGIVGPATQQRMVRSAIVRSAFGTYLPKGLIEGQVASESGGYIAAVNDKVAGGLDLGYTQKRVLGPPFDEANVEDAMDPLYAIARSVQNLYEAEERYRFNRHPNCPFNAWELAALRHNWPWAADTYWRYGRLPDPGRFAPWVPASLPASAKTYDGWAHFYTDMITKDVVW